MEFLKNVFWFLLFGAALALVYVAGWRGYFDSFKYSDDGTVHRFSRSNWRRIYPWISVVLLVIFAAVALSGCSASEPTPPPVAVANCQGSYVGSYGPPEHDERIRLRNMSLKDRGIAVTGNHDIDNANAGGGAPDGGIWMGGSYAFETDANCNVTKGKTLIFYAYEYDIGGTVQKDGTFNLVWSGQGSAGEMVGKVEADNNITGKFFHPAPDSYVYGVLSGTFTPAVK